MSERQYTECDCAKVALWLDDPYGDGIRLRIVREPSAARVAALDFVRSGQRTLTNDEQSYIDCGKKYLNTKQGRASVDRQGVL